MAIFQHRQMYRGAERIQENIYSLYYNTGLASANLAVISR